MSAFVEPRRFTPGSGRADAGLPGDRGARLAARHAFADLKLGFLRALDGLPGTEWLAAQVRHAEEPVDLWLLRAPVFSALQACGPPAQPRDIDLRRAIDSMFPDLDSRPLPSLY